LTLWLNVFLLSNNRFTHNEKKAGKPFSVQGREAACL
jgi:hypothetical protein